jgi:septum formation protein
MPDLGPTRHDVVLASASIIRRKLLESAGLQPRIVPARLDEGGFRRDLGTVEPAVVALELAKAKAMLVSRWERGAIVIGADQVLAINGETISKADEAEEAKAVLMKLRGRKHSLYSGVSVARDGIVLWTSLDSAHLKMRSFTEAWIEDYLSKVGPEVAASVGCYQLEGIGVQLFERIDGDYFTILGLPLLPLLAFLRSEGVIGT